MKINRATISFIVFTLFLVTAGWAQKPQINSGQLRQLERVARSHESRGRYLEALNIWEQLWNTRQANVSYYRGVLRNQMRLKMYEAAVGTVNRMLQVRPDAYIEADLGDVYYQAGDEKKAKDTWKKIINRHSKNPLAYQAVANSMIANRLIDEAIDVYEKGRLAVANRDIFLLELANLYHSKIDYKHATALYVEYLRYQPQKFKFIESQIGRLAEDIEDWKPIASFIKNKLRNDNNNLILRKLLASLYMQFAEYKLAYEEYKYIDEHETQNSKKPDDQWGRQLFLFAGNAMRDSAFTFAKQAFAMLIGRYPKSRYLPDAYMGLADATYYLKNYAEAIRLYQEISDKYSKRIQGRDALFKIGDIHLNVLHQPDEAKAIFTRILKRYPRGKEHHRAIFKIATCEMFQDNLQEASEWLGKIIRSKNVSEETRAGAIYKQAQIDYWQGRFDPALRHLEKISEVHTIRYHEEGMFVNDALEMILFIEENRKDSTALALFAEAQLRMSQIRRNAALALLNKLVDEYPTCGFIDRVWLNIGDLEYQLQNYKKAMEAYTHIVEKYPESLLKDVAQQAIGRVYEKGLGNIPAAIKAYETILSDYPDSMLLETVRRKIRELEQLGMR